MKRKMVMVALVFALTGAVILSGEVSAQETKPEDFYKGATIDFIVPYGPGGTYDIWARTLAPLLQKHTGAKVVVHNKFRGYPGIDYIYSGVKPDGLTIGITGIPGLAVGKMLGSKDAAKSDIEKLSYLGRVSVEDRALFTGKLSGLKTIAEMQKSTQPIRFSSQGGAADSAVDSTLVSEGFGLNSKVGTGSPGSAEDLIYLTEGKKDAKCNTWSADYREAVRKGDLNLILFFGKNRNPEFPQVPTALEAPGITAGGRKYLELLTLLHQAGRTVFSSPGVPQERVLFLEKALAASLKEPELLERFKKEEIPIVYLSGKDCKEAVAKMMGIVPQAERAELKRIIFEKYY